MKKIVLIGIPNAGKSTLGRLAANALQLPFFDTDTLIFEKMEFTRRSDIFRMGNGELFLKLQQEVVEKLVELDNSAIIATGAETALAPECAKLLKKIGTIIHIHREYDIVLAGFKNTIKSGFYRKEEDGTLVPMQGDILGLYMKEMDHYNVLADLTLENNGTEEEGLDKLIYLIKQQVD